MPETRRQLINQQAWGDILPQVRNLFHTRQAELLAQSGMRKRVPRGPRRIAGERSDRFVVFVEALLDSGHLDAASDETLDLIKVFLAKPTAGNRLRLLTNLARPGLLNAREAAELGKFS